VNPDPALAPLFGWLTLRHPPRSGWEPEPPLEELRCHPDLVARLAEVARPIGAARRRFVAGCPVIEHPSGQPIAAAAGTGWLAVRSGLPAGALDPGPSGPPAIDGIWVELDPWAPDAGFAHATDLLRAHIARAYDTAGAESET
jgi:hypothetical protein